MPIVLKYGSPGPILGAGFAAGYGHRQNEREKTGLALWQQEQQRRFQADQQTRAFAQQTALQQAGFVNQQALQKAALGQQKALQQAGQTFQAEQAGLQRTFQEGQQKKEFDFRSKESELARQNRLLEDFDSQVSEGLRRGQLQLPKGMQEQLDKLDSEFAKAIADDELDAAQKEEAATKYQKRKREIMRSAQPVPEQSDAERRQKAVDLLPEEHRGHPWLIDENNKLSLPSGYKIPDQAGEHAKQMEKFQKENKDYLGLRDKEAQRLADAQEIQKGGKAKPLEDFLDQADASLQKRGYTKPQMPGQAVPPSPAQSPAGQVPVPAPDPRLAQAYNDMQAQLGAGVSSWTSAGGQAAAERHTDQKTGNVYEKRNGTWVRVQ